MAVNWIVILAVSVIPAAFIVAWVYRLTALRRGWLVKPAHLHSAPHHSAQHHSAQNVPSSQNGAVYLNHSNGKQDIGDLSADYLAAQLSSAASSSGVIKNQGIIRSLDSANVSVEDLSAHTVFYLSERSSHSPLRLVPWDASGTLSETEIGFRFVGRSTNGEPVDMHFPSDDIEINYRKGNLLWDGGLPWFVIEVNGEKHFFTSRGPSEETSNDVLSHPSPSAEVSLSTSRVYRSLTDRYLRTN